MQNTKEQMYRSNEEFLLVQQNFQNYMAHAEWWQQMQFITAILGTLCWLAIFVICCRYKKTIIATILASQQLDKLQMVKTIPV